MAIENVSAIDERRSKLARNRVSDWHLDPPTKIPRPVHDSLLRVRRETSEMQLSPQVA